MRDSVLILFLLIVAYSTTAAPSSASLKCNAYFVRWPRVRLNFRPIATSRLSLRTCENACSLGEDPQLPGRALECAALNHHAAPDGFAHQCDVFQPHQLQNVDGYVEADDRYSFFWKYCLNSSRKCGGEYAFTYLSDRYMNWRDVIRITKKASLEDCLVECLEEKSIPCRSVSFNRTDGGCHISADSQLTKPQAIRLNNNPNFRIDYYENNCYNLTDTFKFEQECREDGIFVKVKSKFPYTGALYGLYDFFTCRVEPVQSTEFGLLFPSPTSSKNCSDSIRFQGDEMVLDVVLSTDGIEPLYFITPDDLTYQAKCPIVGKSNSKAADPVDREKQLKFTTEKAHTEKSARTISLKATSKAKLFKQTYPLPLITTQKTPSPSTKDATFKQVVQDIIRDHLDKANVTADELSSGSGEFLNAKEELFLAHFDPDNLPFLTKFQAPIFDFFTKLTDRNNVLEHSNQSTLSTIDSTTQSTLGSTGKFITDRTLSPFSELTTSESVVSDEIGISAQELTSLAPEPKLEEKENERKANAKDMEEEFPTTQNSESESEGSGSSDVTGASIVTIKTTKKAQLGVDEKILVSDVAEVSTTLRTSTEQSPFKENGYSAKFSTDGPLNEDDENIQLLIGPEEGADSTNSTEFIEETSTLFSDRSITSLATEPITDATSEVSTVLHEAQLYTAVELVENTTEIIHGTTSLFTEGKAFNLPSSSSGEVERREYQKTTTYPKTSNEFENVDFAATTSDESTQVPSSTEKISMETVDVVLPMISNSKMSSDEEVDALISKIQQVLAPLSREGLSKKLNRKSGDFSTKAGRTVSAEPHERMQNKSHLGSISPDSLSIQQNRITESLPNPKSEPRVAADSLPSSTQQLHNATAKEKSDGDALIISTPKLLQSKVNRQIQIHEKQKIKFDRKTGTKSGAKIIQHRSHHNAMTQGVKKSLSMTANRDKTFKNRAGLHEGSHERKKIVDGSIKGIKTSKPTPAKASGTSKRKQKDKRSDFFLRRGPLIIPVRRFGQKIIEDPQTVQKNMTFQERAIYTQKSMELDNKPIATNTLKGSEHRKMLGGVKIAEAEQPPSHPNSSSAKPMLIVIDGVVQRLTAAGASKELLEEIKPLLKNRRLSRRVLKLLQFLLGSVEKTKEGDQSKSQDAVKLRMQRRQEGLDKVIERTETKHLTGEKLEKSGQSKHLTEKKGQSWRKKSNVTSSGQLKKIQARHASSFQGKGSNLTIELTAEKQKSSLTHDQPVVKQNQVISQKVLQTMETLTTVDPSKHEKPSMQTRPSKKKASRKALHAPNTVTPPNTQRIRRSTSVPTTFSTTSTVTTKPAIIISTIPGTTTATATTVKTTPSTTSTTTTSKATTTTKAPTTTKATTTTTKVFTQESTTTTPSTTSATTTRATLNRSPVIFTAGPPGTSSSPEEAKKPVKGAVSFDIFHNGRPVEAVVVGTKITLSFAPLYAVPPEYMSVRECQVEPIDSKYEWEREPLPIIREGCQADLVGLVCPPKQSEFGVKVTVESFRYQSTPHVQYSCLVRICPFAPCPPDSCPLVDGCPRDKRSTRSLSLEEIRRALEADPKLASQIGISPNAFASRPGPSVESQLLALGGDHTVKRRLVVVNSEDQLRYYVRTGDVS